LARIPIFVQHWESGLEYFQKQFSDKQKKENYFN